MSDWPGAGFFPATILTCFDQKHPSVSLSGNPTAGGTWPAANRAIFVPIVVDEIVTVSKIAVLPTVQSGNLDVGIYREDGTRLVSAGSTAVGTAGAVQVIDITDTVLDPGVYFLALCVDNTTAAFQRQATGAGNYLQICGVQQQAVGAVTLPNPATFANPASAYCPVISALVMSATM